jgi:hypothetical protein
MFSTRAIRAEVAVVQAGQNIQQFYVSAAGDTVQQFAVENLAITARVIDRLPAGLLI